MVPLIGLNRGGLTDVLEKTRLTHSERDKLYENRVNPIYFPWTGCSGVWSKNSTRKTK